MSKKLRKPQKFSEYFNLASAKGFEFVDIYANKDTQLFLDPFGISAMGTDWSKECESQITTYFQCLIDCIKTKDKRGTEDLLNALHEVDEIGLGFSQNAPSGRGIGVIQAKDIQKAFETSKAAQSGDIKDIADCALLIPGISRDKISDITANILKRQLIQFTQEVCRKYKIPTQNCPVYAFNPETLNFQSYFTELPVINGNAKILLPIASVRREPQLNKDRYYRNFVIEFLRAEYRYAGSSLARVLKNGKIKVTKSDVRAKHPMTIDLLSDFSKSHPEILDKYKSELRRTALTDQKPQLIMPVKIRSAKERIKTLTELPSGKIKAGKYHDFTYDSLIHILSYRVSNPIKENSINDGRKRIDIVFDNNDPRGLLHKLNTLYRIKCPKIIVECKNYGSDVSNPEIDQLSGRLNDRRGKFGILVCRSINNKVALINRCKDVLNGDGKYIIFLDDQDLCKLLEFREGGKENAIDQLLKHKLDNLIM
jgi:hypothetical protein